MANVYDRYKDCRLCPRGCGVDRTSGEQGFCRAGTRPVVAFAGLHKGEEPPLAGEVGSGTVFFSGCTLCCPACQNFQLSGRHLGRELGTEELSGIFIKLLERGAPNLNLVTGTHFLPEINQALLLAGKNDPSGSGRISVPVVWNTSGYENQELIECLHHLVDVYLPDLKTLDNRTAFDLFGRPDYPAIIRQILPVMAATKPLVWNGDLLQQGVIVRHLVLPNLLESTKECLIWFADHLAGKALLSLMFQYIPLAKGRRTTGKKVSEEEHDEILRMLDELGIDDGFVQGLPESDAWIPNFDLENPFPADCATPVWHYKHGIVRT